MKHQLNQFEKALRKELKKQHKLCLGEVCGSGSFCECYKVYDNSGKLYGVAKVLQINETNQELSLSNNHSLIKEYNILKKSSEIKNIINLQPVSLENYSTFKCIEPYGFYIMKAALPLSNADEFLDDWINTYSVQTVVSYLAFAVCNALSSMVIKFHQFSHRDIKPANLFVFLGNLICLTKDSFALGDFGIANFDVNAATHAQNIRNPNDPFSCPDLIQTTSSDIYSLGCTLAFYLNMSIPNVDIRKRNEKVYASNDVNEQKDLDELKSFVQRMMNRSPSSRPSLKECLAFFEERVGKYETRVKAVNDCCKKAITSFASTKSSSSAPITNYNLIKASKKSMRFSGINYLLENDISAAKAQFDKAGKEGDTISKFYRASIEAKYGQKGEAIRMLKELYNPETIPYSHPLRDNVLALLYSLDYPLYPLEKVSASSVLSKHVKDFRFI